MFQAVIRKILADIRTRPMQTILSFIMVMGVAAMLMLAISAQQSVTGTFDRAHELAHGAHVWFGVNGQEVADKIAGRPGVEEVSTIYEQVRGALFGSGDPDDVVFLGTGEGVNGISPAIISEGRWTIENGDEIVISTSLAKSAGLELGDKVHATTVNSESSLTVVGIATDTSFYPYPYVRPGVVFVSQSTVRQLIGGPLEGLSNNELGERRADFAFGVRLDSPESADTFASDMRTRFTGEVFFYRSWLSVRDYVTEVNEAPVIVMRIFSILSLLALGIILASTISGHVLGQTRDIGVLKASGFGPWHIALTFIGQHLMVGFTATLVGVTAGLLLTPTLVRVFSQVPYAPPAIGFDPAMVIAVVAGVISLILVFTLFPAWRAGRISTVAAISRRFQAGPSVPSGLARAARRLNLPHAVVFGAKDAFARRSHAWLTIATVAVVGLTAMMALMFDDLVNRFESDPASLGGWPFQIRVDRLPEFGTPQAAIGQFAAGVDDPISQEEAVALVESRQEVEAHLISWESPSRIEGFDRWVSTHIIEGPVEEFGFRVTDGRMFSEAGEAVVGLGLAEDFGLEVGDEMMILFPIGDDRFADVPVTVVGKYVSQVNGGITLMYRSDTLNDLTLGDDSNAYFGSINLKLKPGVDAAAFAVTLMDQADGKVLVTDLVEEFQSSHEDERRILPLFVTLTGVLVAFAAMSMMISLVFTVRERTREFGIMKTVGFTPWQIVLSVVMGAAILAVIGVAIGAPLGYFVTREVAMRFADTQGMPNDLLRAPSVLWQASLVPFAVVLAALGAALPAWQAANIRISEALRFD